MKKSYSLTKQAQSHKILLVSLALFLLIGGFSQEASAFPSFWEALSDTYHSFFSQVTGRAFIPPPGGGDEPPSGDSDEDGIFDVEDNCPYTANPTQEDTDADGVGNACDNCAQVANPNQEDCDGDTIGDACDTNSVGGTCPPIADQDGDGIQDSQDNCPQDYNPEQTDADADGYGAACDCDDDAPFINPDVAEVCDGEDNNCDGDVDEGCSSGGNPCFDDLDNDGYVDEACSSGTDCDDFEPTVNPGETELCADGLDNNCDGLTDAADVACAGTCLDADADTYTTCAGDCDDSDAQVYPSAEETQDGLDNNCDGEIDEPENAIPAFLKTFDQNQQYLPPTVVDQMIEALDNLEKILIDLELKANTLASLGAVPPGFDQDVSNLRRTVSLYKQHFAQQKTTITQQAAERVVQEISRGLAKLRQAIIANSFA